MANLVYIIAGYFGIGACVSFLAALKDYKASDYLLPTTLGLLWLPLMAFAVFTALAIAFIWVANLPMRAGRGLRSMLGKDA